MLVIVSGGQYNHYSAVKEPGSTRTAIIAQRVNTCPRHPTQFEAVPYPPCAYRGDIGQSADSGSAACSICPAGTYYAPDIFPCKVCPAGKIIEDDGEDPSLHQNISSCVNCAAGVS